MIALQEKKYIISKISKEEYEKSSMNSFNSIEPAMLKENAVKLIGSDWMLITAGKIENFNTMTASWGFLGFLWNKPCAVCFVRPERHTYGFIENADNFTLSFFSEEYRDILKFCGAQSGKNVNKIEKTGLKPFALENGTVSFEQSRLILNCRKLYAEKLSAESFFAKGIIDAAYADGSFHKMYIAEITEAFVK